MPQLSPLNWVFLSLGVLFVIFMIKVFFSFLTVSKLKFVESSSTKSKSFGKWNW